MKAPRTIEEQAAQLARWLDEHPGSAPPEGVDPDVLEAIYAMRPELAPAPSFSIDDILAEITTGPFASSGSGPEATAEPSGAEIVPLPTPELERDDDTEEAPATGVVDLATERRRRRPWLWSAAGAVAAAAMALIVITPFVEKGVPDAVFESEQAQMPAASPEPAPIAELEQDGWPPPARPDVEQSGESKEKSPAAAAAFAPPGDGTMLEPDAAVDALSRTQQRAPAQPGTAGPTTNAAGGTASGVVGGGALDVSSDQAEGRLGAAAAQSGDAPASWFAEDRADAAGAPGPTPASPSPRSSPDPSPPPAEPAGAAFVDLPVEEPTLDYDDDLGDHELADDLEMPSATTIVSEDRSSGRREREVERKRADEYAKAEAEAEAFELEESSGMARRSRGEERLSSVQASRSRDTRGGGLLGGLTDRSREASAPSAVSEPEEPSALAPAMGLDDLRAQANPLDYRSDWYLREPGLDVATRTQLASVFGEVQAAVIAGDSARTLELLRPLLGSGDPSVVQDASFRIATIELQVGQRAAALGTVQRGLAASGSPTVHRARLLALLGSILEEQGDAGGAMDAYRQAVESNQARY
jgi:hypothetical protein